jgi:flagellum-specific peptidoglycan hydrolase FlgJ
MNLTPAEVFEKILQMNREGGLMAPLNALGVTAQTCHETGWYKHTGGDGNFNLGGIKCSDNWLDGRIPWSTRQCRSLKTQEFVNGKFGDYRLAFRWHDRLETYLKDHARLIALFYPVSRDNADCAWGYVAGVHGKWATGPSYFQSVGQMVIRLAPELVGADWMAKLQNSFAEAERRGVLSPNQRSFLRSRLA